MLRGPGLVASLLAWISSSLHSKVGVGAPAARLRLLARQGGADPAHTGAAGAALKGNGASCQPGSSPYPTALGSTSEELSLWTKPPRLATQATREGCGWLVMLPSPHQKTLLPPPTTAMGGWIPSRI